MARKTAFLLVFALACGAAKPAAPNRSVEVATAVFELCPRVLNGEILLTDPAQVAQIGFTATAPRETPSGKIPRAERGQGAEKIVIAGHKTATSQTCAVWFGGPDNKKLLKLVRKTATQKGYTGGKVMLLGDGTGLALFRRPDVSLTVIEADAGGEYGAEPATTVIYIPEKAN